MSEEITAKEYFDELKDKKKTITDKELSNIYDNCMTLMKKYITTGQVTGAKKIMFHLDTIEKEKKIVSMGVDTFLYRDDIEYYIENVAAEAVKIIELERYPREIPDEIVKVIAATKDIFDQMYVVFTDYTGNVTKQAVEERDDIHKERDPILFGTFQNKEAESIVDRFYFLGDWEDEYCDLTLDKMISQIREKTGKDVTRKISAPTDLKELKEQLSNLEEVTNKKFRVQRLDLVTKKKTSFFDKIKSIFKK